mgnify:CR=1 FL=1
MERFIRVHNCVVFDKFFGALLGGEVYTLGLCAAAGGDAEFDEKYLQKDSHI